MRMSTRDESPASGPATTFSTVTRGSHRPTASRTACTISPRVFGSTGANSRSQIPQPKSGRMTRSPGAVDRIRRRAASTSSDIMAMPPLGPPPIGKAHPRPTKSRSGLIRPSPDQHRVRAGDDGARGGRGGVVAGEDGIAQAGGRLAVDEHGGRAVLDGSLVGGRNRERGAGGCGQVGWLVQRDAADGGGGHAVDQDVGG